jgi:hypothetical protein
MRYFWISSACVLAAVLAMAAEPPESPSLDSFKVLAGEWVQVDRDGKPTGQPGVTYRVTANGSAVLETIFPGTDHEMITMYHRDGKDLVLTHYCALGNQPRMRCRKIDGNVLRFEFEGGTNLDPAKDAHMHDATFTFVDANTLVSAWTMWEGGKAAHKAEFRYGRKK